MTLVERAPLLSAVGAGILLQPSGLRVLSRLGCLAHMQTYGHRIDALHGHTRAGRTIMQVAYADLNEPNDVYGLGVHRESLCHVLDTALRSIPHKRWFGCEVHGIEQKTNAAVIEFSTNEQVQQAAFDAVLVANGSASRLRPSSLVRYDKPYPWGAMWSIRPLTDRLDFLRAPCLQQRYASSEQMAGALPTGYSPSSPNTQLVSFFWSLPVARMNDWHDPSFSLTDWKNQVIELWPELSPLLADIHAPSELVSATYRDVIMSRWGLGRVGVIGDAAHAMSPQLGQGANMALLDAEAIAYAIAACNDWDAVWQQFAKDRSGSIRFYQRMSRLLTPFFQSSIMGAGFARDISMPLLYRLPWLRTQMAETVAGRKQGWLK